MANIRDIRRRIKAVKNISQVTKAMEAVAAAKMRKAQDQVVATRPYAKSAGEVLSYVARLPNAEHSLDALIQPRPIKKACVVLITGDRGLAGGFNSNVIRKASSLMKKRRDDGVDVSVIAIGKKGRDWLLRYDPVIHAEFIGMSDSPTEDDASPVARLLIDEFVQGNFDVVDLVYTDFVNTLSQVPVVHQLLPVIPAEPSVEMAPDYIFEPSPDAVLERVLYGFTEVQILQGLYESIASEYSARMVAMRNATEAANELVDSLTLTYNKARQAGITNELIDIVGGATALD